MSDLIKTMVVNKLAGLKTNREGIINAIQSAETEKAEQQIRLDTIESQIKECETFLGDINE